MLTMFLNTPGFSALVCAFFFLQANRDTVLRTIPKTRTMLERVYQRIDLLSNCWENGAGTGGEGACGGASGRGSSGGLHVEHGGSDVREEAAPVGGAE